MSFAANDGGTNYVTGQEDIFKDSAIATTLPIIIDKDIYSTDQIHTSASTVVPGEVITYAIKVTMPEGSSTSNMDFTDDIPVGLRYYRDSSHSARVVGAAGVNAGECNLLTSSFLGTLPLALTKDPVDLNDSLHDDGGDLTASFSEAQNIQVTNDVNPNNNSFCILYEVVVDEDATDGAKTNEVDFRYGAEIAGVPAHSTTGPNGLTQVIENGTPSIGQKDNMAKVNVVHPNLLVTKTVSMKNGGDIADVDAGDS